MPVADAAINFGQVITGPADIQCLAYSAKEVQEENDVGNRLGRESEVLGSLCLESGHGDNLHPQVHVRNEWDSVADGYKSARSVKLFSFRVVLTRRHAYEMPHTFCCSGYRHG